MVVRQSSRSTYLDLDTLASDDTSFPHTLDGGTGAGRSWEERRTGAPPEPDPPDSQPSLPGVSDEPQHWRRGWGVVHEETTETSALCTNALGNTVFSVGTKEPSFECFWGGVL